MAGTGGVAGVLGYGAGVTGDALDVVLGILAVIFAVSGFRQGLVTGFLSLCGFLGGGVLGAHIAPMVTEALKLHGVGESLVALACVFALAAIGQLAASAVGYAFRRRMRWQSARAIDSVGGALLSVIALLLVAWLVATAVVQGPFPALAGQVRHSAVLRAVDDAVPDQARNWFSSFRRVVGRGAFPQVFGGLGPDRTVPVRPPDPGVARTPRVQHALDSVVKVQGTAPKCSRRIEGSGFVYARHRVLTNAHVVAGVTIGPTVSVGGRSYDARVVVFDPRRDVAVLYVPDLPTDPLRFDGTAERGDDAVVAGYPGGGPLRVGEARIRSQENARGPGIYQHTQNVREIYAIRATVRPGNSGGPLLGARGRVYGVVFAAAVDDPQTGYALTTHEVRPDARRGRHTTQAVSTRQCD
ncbi:MAG: MarP family serine protease [Streptosporangiales bacterium]